MATTQGPGLYEFLIEAELQQYYSNIRNDLKIQNVPQLKYVTEDDLQHIGMSKPEIRRLKKFFQKHYPQTYISKFKKMILPKREEQVSSMMVMLPDEGVDKPPIKVPNKHIIPAEAIMVNKELGTGEFGVVQQGVWTNDGDRIQVAIKCLSRERMQNNPIEFLKEAAIMHAIDHEHIVRLYGVVLDTNALMLVTELAPLRSLLECLKEVSLRSSFPVLSLCDFAIQICDGMQYLETKRLIHRDLAARNILVFSKNKVKISDFGLSRALGVGKDYYQTNFNVNLKLPIAWCAPECISYLRFTSASDVWAYGVTLWEMFSYGFQPWAALTGHQILEAIDEPNFQRLEQPEACPKEYFNIMLKCWQHDPNKRPKFSNLITMLPECKPEQVQAVQDYVEDPVKVKREQLCYRVGDIITVLDKVPLPSVGNCWKGVLNNGKTGLFNPAHTVAYLGSNLPSNKPGEFVRGVSSRSSFSGLSVIRDGKSVYASRRRLKPDMISGPQGDLKHTGHVGLDGAYFGDISFLGGKYHHLPRQVVTPYKPHEDSEHVSDRAPLLTGREVEPGKDPVEGKHFTSTNPSSPTIPSGLAPRKEVTWSDVKEKDGSVQSDLCATNKRNSKQLMEHEYHEISDEENLMDSPRSEKSFDFGPSLMDEMDAMFRSLGSSPPSSPALPPSPASPLDEAVNVRNELREIAAKVTGTGKKKQATVKPISAADERTLDTAIAMAKEFTTSSMSNLGSGTPPESPHSPTTPNKRKFFHFPTPIIGKHGSPKFDRRTFSEEAASIPDIQSTLTEEAKEVYNSLVEQPIPSSPPSQDTNPLRMLRSGAFPMVRPRVRGNKYAGNAVTLQPTSSAPAQLEEPSPVATARSLPRVRVPPPAFTMPATTVELSFSRSRSNTHPVESCPRTQQDDNWRNSESDAEHANSEHSEDSSSVDQVDSAGDQEEKTDNNNPIPLPPRDRSKPMPSVKTRHQRKHPLIIPGSGILAKMVEAVEDHADTQELTNGCDVSNSPDDTVGHNTSMDDSFEQHIACQLEALDDIPEQGTEESLPSPVVSMVRHSDHVSCEDLLEFACDTPNAKRTRGKAHGIESDEVRIMGKVLGSDLQVSSEGCVAALNVCDWDVHQAIKVARLHHLLRTTPDLTSVVTLEACNTALGACSWDVACAATWIIAQQQGGATQV